MLLSLVYSLMFIISIYVTSQSRLWHCNWGSLTYLFYADHVPDLSTLPCFALFCLAAIAAFLLMIHQLAPVIERLVLPFLDDQYAEALEAVI